MATEPKGKLRFAGTKIQLQPMQGVSFVHDLQGVAHILDELIGALRRAKIEHVIDVRNVVATQHIGGRQPKRSRLRVETNLFHEAGLHELL
eukprot:11696580-Alexandrium_andersonii.AAC.1